MLSVLESHCTPSNANKNHIATYKTKLRDVHKLRERIVDERDKLDQRVIDKVAAKWRERLRACVVAGGGQFEHKI